jgi:hypothetical protein
VGEACWFCVTCIFLPNKYLSGYLKVLQRQRRDIYLAKGIHEFNVKGGLWLQRKKHGIAGSAFFRQAPEASKHLNPDLHGKDLDFVGWTYNKADRRWELHTALLHPPLDPLTAHFDSPPEDMVLSQVLSQESVATVTERQKKRAGRAVMMQIRPTQLQYTQSNKTVTRSLPLPPLDTVSNNCDIHFRFPPLSLPRTLRITLNEYPLGKCFFRLIRS